MTLRNLCVASAEVPMLDPCMYFLPVICKFSNVKVVDFSVSHTGCVENPGERPAVVFWDESVKGNAKT